MMAMFISVFLVQYLLFSSTLLVFTRFGSAASQGACKGTKYCSNKLGPPIRPPFWVQDTQQPAADHSCCYPEFEVSCSSNDTLLLHPLPSFPSIKFRVIQIDYQHQVIQAVSLQGEDCFPLQLLNCNLSASPFQFSDPFGFNYLRNFDWYNCSSPPESESYLGPRAPCLNARGIYIARSGSDISYELGTSCTKIGTTAAVSYSIFDYANKSSNITLTWLKPNFRNCEAAKKFCSPRNYTQAQTICVPKPDVVKEKLKLAGAILGSFFLLLAIVAFFYFYSSNKLEKQNQAKIEKFLEDYRALRPARYSYADLKYITNQFREKLGQGGYGTVYKGILSLDIFVAVKVLNNSKENGEDFINEVGTIGKIHHVNVVRLVGFCADGFVRALVYEFLPNDSLEKYIFSENSKNQHLGWKKLQHIALGIARGIEYLHQGCDQRILHFDIKPHNIMLDHNFNPKISDFGLAKLCSKEQSAVSMTAARGTMGYIAPEVLSRNFGKVSYKSDVYSYGMLLLEMVGGRKNKDVKVENISQIYFPEWIYNRLEQGEELRIRIQEDNDDKMVKKLTIVGLWCIQWNPVDRPSMKVVIQMLEGDTDSLAIPPNPFSTRNASRPGRHLEQELAVISELE